MRVFFLLMILSCSHLSGKKAHELKVAHYNILELSTEKIENLENVQMKAAKRVLSQIDYDILSLQEIQYDQPGVPSSKFQTRGENLKKLKMILGKPDFREIFFPANTGENARKLKNGNYATSDHDDAKKYADPINYGLFPAQYSFGALTRLPVKKVKVISSLRWQDFNQDIDLKKYDLPPETPLFDKNFTHATVNFHGHDLHLILLHAAPAYNFEKDNSPNFIRNRDQLRFLEWYLTGETDIQVNLVGIEALKKDSLFTAMGDFNVDIKKEKPGSSVLKRLKNKFLFPVDSRDATHKKDLTLDYIITSNQFKVDDAKILKGPSEASDHFPLWTKLKILLN